MCIFFGHTPPTPRARCAQRDQKIWTQNNWDEETATKHETLKWNPWGHFFGPDPYSEFGIRSPQWPRRQRAARTLCSTKRCIEPDRFFLHQWRGVQQQEMREEMERMQEMGAALPSSNPPMLSHFSQRSVVSGGAGCLIQVVRAGVPTRLPPRPLAWNRGLDAYWIRSRCFPIRTKINNNGNNSSDRSSNSNQPQQQRQQHLRQQQRQRQRKRQRRRQCGLGADWVQTGGGLSED
eukprot:gene6934-biopygen22473